MALRIHQSASAAQAKQYYTQSLAHSDYYARDGQSPGLWFGQGAKRLGLEGEVEKDAFFALLDNRRPDGSGERLTARDKGGLRRPGWDLTFSPPKAVTLLRALTGDGRIADALRESALETLAEIEAEGVKTRLRRGGQQGAAPTGNAVFSLFFHDTTRELADGKPDPHDHIHAYLHNASWAEHEQRWQAIDTYDVHVDRPYYEAAFEARLANKLAGLGYGIERRADGWTVAGVPQSAVDKFSRRTAEIEAEAKRLGITDPDRKGELGAKTRRKKGEPLAPETLRDYWVAKLTPGEWQALAETSHAAASGDGSASTPGPSAAQALAHAGEHLFERDSTVPVKKLLTEALRFGVGSMTPEEVKQALPGQGLLIAEAQGRPTATTRRAIEQERNILRFARAGRGTCDPLGGYGPPHAPRRDFLNASQKQAVRELLGSFDRVMILRGKAGVGKSTSLAEVRDGVEAAGRRVLAVAPTTGAVDVLAKDGFQAATIARLLIDEGLQAELKGNVLLVDEAGLVGTSAMKALFDLARREGARVVLSGDSAQHRAVEAGTALRLLEERAGLKAVTLDEILRQQGDLKEAVAALGRGDGEGGFARLDALGRIEEIPDAEQRYRQLAREYADTLAKGQEALAIAPTHAEGASVVGAIRDELKTRGVIGKEESTVLRLESKNLTEAQRRDFVNFQPGDTVQFRQNAKGGWKRGQRVTVVASGASGVGVRTGGGAHGSLPLDQADKFQVYRTGELALAPGDRVRFTQAVYAGKKRLAANGAVATVKGFAADGSIQLEGGGVLARDHGHLAPGWVVTSMASQGRTVKGTVFVAQAGESLPASSREQFYVSASRGHDVRFFTDDKEGLRRAVTRPDRPLSATELSELAQKPQQAAERRQKHAGWLQRLEYFAKVVAEKACAATRILRNGPGLGKEVAYER